jgi:hypothetical protein
MKQGKNNMNNMFDENPKIEFASEVKNEDRCSNCELWSIEYKDLAEEATELRNAIAGIQKAIQDEGKMPSYHRSVMKRHREEWGSLHLAIDKAVKLISFHLMLNDE